MEFTVAVAAPAPGAAPTLFDSIATGLGVWPGAGKGRVGGVFWAEEVEAGVLGRTENWEEGRRGGNESVVNEKSS